METIIQKTEILAKIWEVKWVNQSVVRLVWDIFDLDGWEKWFFAMLDWKPELLECVIWSNWEISIN